MTQGEKPSLRVVQVVAGLDPAAGGPPTSAIATALALRRRGFRNELIYVAAPARESAEAVNQRTLQSMAITTHGFPATRLARSRGVRWGVSHGLAFWLLRNARRFDVFHVHGAWTFTAVVGLMAAKLHGRVAVLATHESLTDFDRSLSGPFGRVMKRGLRRFYLSAFDCIVVSSSLEQRDSGDPTARRTAIVPHAVRGFTPVGSPSGPAERLRVGYLGRFHAKKNLPVLIKAIARTEPLVELVIAGDGPRSYSQLLKDLVQDEGIAERVIWRGFIDDGEKPEFFSSIDVLAMPSSYECFGVAAVEAMSSGIPLIVTPSVGIADVAKRHSAALIVSPDPEPLAKAIERYATDPAFLRLAGEAARVASEEFSLERHGERLEREYTRLVSAARAANWRHPAHRSHA